ncbi:deoxyribodipyrimidine photo-lyase [bacterium]|nr:deoxyribodipyrimidine photo-lyase [bacterium]
MNQKRVRVLKDAPASSGPVVCWMSRDMRAQDNWALLYAQGKALELKQPLHVVFCLVPSFIGATIRHYGFMLKGLAEVERDLARKNIAFSLLAGDPARKLEMFVEQRKASLLVTDFDPLAIKTGWKNDVAAAVDVPFHEVDAHNIVPCWIASPKREFGAYTLRPKINRLLPEFLEEFPALRTHPFGEPSPALKTDWARVRTTLDVDASVGEVDWLTPGPRAARRALDAFIEHKLAAYNSQRNDPSKDGQSNLSPYLHFGQIAPQRVALDVRASSASPPARAAFLEELIVRRELADNFCFYTPDYDNSGCFPAWAARTLADHRRDTREYLYSLEQLDQAATHDHLWNAAQREMVNTGKMHGYMRMYWAKKILEWSPSPEEAMRVAIHLNDRYELDGRDPNGYAGIAWSIGGVHDRAWFPRPVFGKIRYMSFNGCKSKFSIKEYEDKVRRSELRNEK